MSRGVRGNALVKASERLRKERPGLFRVKTRLQKNELLSQRNAIRDPLSGQQLFERRSKLPDPGNRRVGRYKTLPYTAGKEVEYVDCIICTLEIRKVETLISFKVEQFQALCLGRMFQMEQKGTT
jgi:hypothetical protein